jgi:hypothetical protein
MRVIATQFHLTQDSVLAWRQHRRTPPHHRLNLNGHIGTLDMSMDTWSTRRIVVLNTLTGPLALHGTPAGITPLRGIFFMRLTK